MIGERSRWLSLIGVVEVLVGAFCLASAPCFGIVGGMVIIIIGMLGLRGFGPYPALSEQARLGALITGLAILLAGLAVLVVGILYLRAGKGVLARRRSGQIWTLRLAVVSSAVVVVGFALVVYLADASSTPWHVLPWDQSDREVVLMFGLPVLLLFCGLQAWIGRVVHNERLAPEVDAGIPKQQ